jgi:hypothetical protein
MSLLPATAEAGVGKENYQLRKLHMWSSAGDRKDMTSSLSVQARVRTDARMRRSFPATASDPMR